MTFQDLVQYMRTKLAGIDAGSFEGNAAYQFNVRGEGEGAFYVEIKDGAIYVEGYEYFDRDVIFECDSKVLIDIAEGKLDAAKAAEEGLLAFEGDAGKALAFGNLLAAAKKPAKAAKKPAVKAEKKTAEKKTAAAKAEKKPAAAKAEKKAAAPAKAEKKAAEAPKPAVKAAEAPKAEKKTAEKKKK